MARPTNQIRTSEGAIIDQKTVTIRVSPWLIAALQDLMLTMGKKKTPVLVRTYVDASMILGDMYFKLKHHKKPAVIYDFP